ncbi:MAG: hypothetical protein M3Q65_01640 [Chloroflexota bacterium]|nr:hypothetical protein [Chloroflexota bacterium]
MTGRRQGQDEGATSSWAVFLDRDGTLGGDGHFRHPDEFALYPEAPTAIRLLNDARLKAIVVTNRTRVGAGRITSRWGERGCRTCWKPHASPWRATEDR